MAIVCHCEAVRERTIVKAIHRGASSLADIQDACGAATKCGGCTPAIMELLAIHDVRMVEDRRPHRWVETTA